jgi:hypothetical protein
MNHNTIKSDSIDIKRAPYLISQLAYLYEQEVAEVLHLVSDLRVIAPQNVDSTTAKIYLESDLDPSFSYELTIDHSGKNQPTLVQKFNNELNNKPLYFSEDDKEDFINFSQGMTILKKKEQFFQSIKGLEHINVSTPMTKAKSKSPSLVSQNAAFLWNWRIGMSFASFLLVAVVILLQVMPLEPWPIELGSILKSLSRPLMPLEPEPIVKGSSAPQELVVSKPQLTAQTLQADLTQLGLVATMKSVDKGWMVEVVDLSIDNPEALFILLQKYKLKLPAPGEESLKVRVMAKDNN